MLLFTFSCVSHGTNFPLSWADATLPALKTNKKKKQCGLIGLQSVSQTVKADGVESKVFCKQYWRRCHNTFSKNGTEGIERDQKGIWKETEIENWLIGHCKVSYSSKSLFLNWSIRDVSSILHPGAERPPRASRGGTVVHLRWSSSLQVSMAGLYIYNLNHVESILHQSPRWTQGTHRIVRSKTFCCFNPKLWGWFVV